MKFAAQSAGSGGPAPKFGTFLGVYTPSTLTILGLIMYLRFGWVLGNLGLGITIVVVLIASSITLITGLSASALATNMRVGVGGEYFLISRSLGIELGGAIGIPLFLCRTLSITFYSFGLAESIVSLVTPAGQELSPALIQILAAGIVIATTAVSGRSAVVALKLQIPIMIAVALSLVALAVGVGTGGLRAPEWLPTYRTAPAGFWFVFAVFFPAVTGFTAGIGMSGDLKDPQRSIPRGTLLAVLTGTLVYLIVPVLLATTRRLGPADLASAGIGAWTQVAVLGAWLVYPGLWGAILSSAFGSALGGPRVLQALATDGLAPGIMARLSRTGQPMVATWVSGAIALAAVLLGGLNDVAKFVTILFLTLYVTINLSAAFEKLAGDPSFRPTIRVPWFVSLLGSLGAVVVMFLISPVACVAALTLELALYLFLRSRSMQKRWGDVRAGLWVALTRVALLQLRTHAKDPRNWRPHILLFVGDTTKRIGLVRLANWFNQNRGIVTACRLVEGDLDQLAPEVDRLHAEMDADLEQEGLQIFSEVNIVSDFESGAISVAQANGIAGLQSNTVMFGWPDKRDRQERLLRIMRSVARLKKSTIIARLNWAHEPGQERRIDIWWRGKQYNGDLMLLLTHLMMMNPQWRDARVVIRSIILDPNQSEARAAELTRLVTEIRIPAEAEVVVKPADQTVAEVIHQHSRKADMTFLGLMIPEPGAEAESVDRLIELASGLNTTIFVRNASEFSGELLG
ncbi:amino acid permease [bacterium]|nr:amino acid permease [bacterium]MBU1674237.1 amino acid permease [bacterium]